MNENQLYFAPMEGITGSIYRRAHHRIFGGVDRYYAPFIFTNPKGKISKKDLLEIALEYNEGCRVVPQLLSNCAEDFIATAHTLKEMGYDEVNLNLGCPSSTVASKGRGSGFLGEKEALKAFLADIFEKTDMKISLKTRIGLNCADEFDDILDIYEAFPVEMLIVHPRIRMDYYSGKPDMEAFEKASARMPFPVCYNGDIFTAAAYGRVSEKYSDIRHWMIGRGLLSNPALCREIRGGDCASREELADYYHTMRDEYEVRLQGNKKVVFLMKEFWHYISWILSEEDRQEIDVLMHLRDGAEFFRKAEEIASNCTVVKGQGFHSEMEVHKF